MVPVLLVLVSAGLWLLGRRFAFVSVDWQPVLVSAGLWLLGRRFAFVSVDWQPPTSIPAQWILSSVIQGNQLQAPLNANFQALAHQHLISLNDSGSGVILSVVFVQSCLQFYDLLKHAQHINVLFTMLWIYWDRPMACWHGVSGLDVTCSMVRPVHSLSKSWGVCFG
jgi:hypothetical protein